MRESVSVSAAAAMEFRGNKLSHGAKNCPNDFALVARVLFPRKTAFELAAIAHATERAAKNWLSGSNDPPACVITYILNRITPKPRRR